MKTKTIIIVVLTALLTTFLVVNRDPVPFDFIVVHDVDISKLVVIGVCILIGFILGYIAGRPKKTLSSYDEEIEKGYPAQTNQSSLSDEDRDYIS